MSNEIPEQWYANNAALRSAIAKSLGGYKGQIEKRWHLTPLSWVDIYEPYDCIPEDGEIDKVLLEKDGSAGFLPPDDNILLQRIRRLHELSIENGEVYVISFMVYYSHISFDIEDASGQIFEFDMIFNEGCADADTGFFAVVWDRSTGDEFAHCTTSGESMTKILWKKESLIDRYVPHPGLCHPTSEKVFANDYDTGSKNIDFLDICLMHSSLNSSQDYRKNQLELLLAVAAKLACSEYAIFYPNIVPSEILDNARVSYAEDILKLSMPQDALKLTMSYISSNIYLDEDSPLSRCGMKRKIVELN